MGLEQVAFQPFWGFQVSSLGLGCVHSKFRGERKRTEPQGHQQGLGTNLAEICLKLYADIRDPISSGAAKSE